MPPNPWSPWLDGSGSFERQQIGAASKSQQRVKTLLEPLLIPINGAATDRRYTASTNALERF